MILRHDVDDRKSKQSLYKVAVSFLNFYFPFVIPNKSRLQVGLIDQVREEIGNIY